jgi:hypothetical protein
MGILGANIPGKVPLIVHDSKCFGSLETSHLGFHPLAKKFFGRDVRAFSLNKWSELVKSIIKTC